MTPATPRAEDFSATFSAEARSEHVRYARIVQEDSIRRQVQALGIRIGQYAGHVADRDSDEAAAIVAPVLSEARARLRDLAGRLERAGTGRPSITAALNPAPGPTTAAAARREQTHLRRAERRVIGACLVSGEVRRLVAGQLDSSDFTVPEVAATWEAIAALQRRDVPVDFVLVANQVEQQGALPGVGRGLRPDQLHELAAGSNQVDGLLALETVVRAALTRTLQQARDRLQNLAADRARSGLDVLAGAGHAVEQAATTTRRLTSPPAPVPAARRPPEEPVTPSTITTALAPQPRRGR
jgi:replicative DNA helicase